MVIFKEIDSPGAMAPADSSDRKALPTHSKSANTPRVFNTQTPTNYFVFGLEMRTRCLWYVWLRIFNTCVNLEMQGKQLFWR
jgi:hypothetical protein